MFMNRDPIFNDGACSLQLIWLQFFIESVTNQLQVRAKRWEVRERGAGGYLESLR